MEAGGPQEGVGKEKKIQKRVDGLQEEWKKSGGGMILDCYLMHRVESWNNFSLKRSSAIYCCCF